MRNQGQGHLRQRGPTSWELKFDLGRYANGKRITRHVTFRGTKREAQAELNKLLSRRNEGTFVDPTKMTVGEYLEHWLTVDIDRRTARKTALRHRGIVRHQITPGIGSVPVRKLTPTHIEAFEAGLRRDGYVKGSKAGTALSAQTVLHVHRTLSQALAHAVKTGVLFRNPAEQVKPPRVSRREIAILTKPEIARLLRCAGTLYLPILVAVTTGMRRGELLGLRWSDIDLAGAKLTVNQSLERSKGATTFKSPKTPGSRRTITLPQITIDALRPHRATGAALVFSHGGVPWDPDSLTKAFEKLVAAAGVRRITFHGLRHTHISHQLMDGIHIKVVSERAGHANVSTTLSVYSAFVPNMQADAAKGIDQWLRKEIASEVGGKSVAFPLNSKR